MPIRNHSGVKQLPTISDGSGLRQHFATAARQSIRRHSSNSRDAPQLGERLGPFYRESPATRARAIVVVLPYIYTEDGRLVAESQLDAGKMMKAFLLLTKGRFVN
jgi:hypothetical protein